MSSSERPGREQLLDMAAAFAPACVLGAAAELDLFTQLGERTLSAEQVAHELRADLRGVRTLLDAVAALGLLEKRENCYQVPAELRPLLSERGDETVLPMVRHRMTMLRRWSQLAWTAKSGIPAPAQASIRGAMGDRESFLAAMHTISGPRADDLVARLGPLGFSHLLDVGGASGTWTLAFLRAAPGATATIFDLPDAIGQARQRIEATEYAARVSFAAGDFYRDPLPTGADFAWVSAIIHQHSREKTRELFGKVYQALRPGGRIGIRDLVMEPDRVRPVAGAMFAINMLVQTEDGGTFTFQEIAEDLRMAGFRDPQLSIKTDDMDSVVMGRKP